jgi:hypothetical protein
LASFTQQFLDLGDHNVVRQLAAEVAALVCQLGWIWISDVI